jgi:serine/threonine-protein kinase
MLIFVHGPRRYKIVRSLGRGGMAEVFEAISTGEGGFERRVALKRILEEHESNDTFTRMFRDEANIAAALHHPNIAAVLDFGILDRRPFLIVELVDGTDLGHAWTLGRDSQSPLPAEVALYVVGELARGLECAHAAGVVHRDVKPGNALLSYGGAVKLTDFGIAFTKGPRAERTTTGFTKGTPPYMAPEQMLAGEIDARTDVFALGCTLHFASCGRSPLSIESNVVALMRDEPMLLDSQLPPDVRAIVERATRHTKADRYATAAELAAATSEALFARGVADPQSRLVAWLAALQPRAKAKAGPGKLDALLHPEIVFSHDELEVGCFSTLAAPKPSLEPVRNDDPRPMKRASAATWIGVAGALALGVSASTIGIRQCKSPNDEGATAASAQPAPPPTNERPDTGAAEPSALASAREPEAGGAPMAAEPPEPNASAVTTGRPAKSGSAPTATKGEPATGIVKVSGSGALRSQILVDGRPRGYAPHDLELAVGDHNVELVAADGTRRARVLHVSARHTASAPLEWRVP